MLYKINGDGYEERPSKTVTSGHYMGGHSWLAVDRKAEVLWLSWGNLVKVIVTLKNKKWGFRFIKINRLQVKDPTIDLVFLLAFPNMGP